LKSPETDGFGCFRQKLLLVNLISDVNVSDTRKRRLKGRIEG